MKKIISLVLIIIIILVTLPSIYLAAENHDRIEASIEYRDREARILGLMLN